MSDAHSISQIAKTAHEVNRAFCAGLGDDSHLPWLEAPQWQRSSAMNGVFAIHQGKVSGPQQSHENWMDEKVREGWTYGPTKDPHKKTHPCLVPYAQLSVEDRAKDILFHTVVIALLERVKLADYDPNDDRRRPDLKRERDQAREAAELWRNVYLGKIYGVALDGLLTTFPWETSMQIETFRDIDNIAPGVYDENTPEGQKILSHHVKTLDVEEFQGKDGWYWRVRDPGNHRIVNAASEAFHDREENRENFRRNYRLLGATVALRWKEVAAP